jgi:hypothetical protein
MDSRSNKPGSTDKETGMIHFVVHEDGDAVGTVVVEGVKSGATLSGWIALRNCMCVAAAPPQARSANVHSG